MAVSMTLNESTRRQSSPKRRNRAVVSCTECHRRKQKCDRELPCRNCKSRNKESSCAYETDASASRKKRRQGSSPNSNSNTTPSGGGQPRPEPQSLSSLAANFGYGQTGPSTMGVLKRIEKIGTDAESNDGDGGADSLELSSWLRDNAALKERYKSLIRQLPAKIYLDKLVESYFKSINWQYYFMDPHQFREKFAEWNRLPFSTLTSAGPMSLPAELRTFPAVLFHLCALALLLLPKGPDETFDTLKYAASMTFEDLAADYSESGMAVVNLFGKQSLTMTTIEASFLRTSYLKYTAQVTESWHNVGAAIRDAQELGMHSDSLDPKPANSSIEAVLENQWLIQRRRTIYMILSTWDVNMALILGRPGSIDWRQEQPSLPVDTPMVQDRSKTPVLPRDQDREPPTPLTRSLWMRKLIEPMLDVQELERDGPYPKDFSRVDAVNQKIHDLDETKPAIFRLENPDTRWDDGPEGIWIRDARYYFVQLYHFSLMALHRQYVFHRKESRRKALVASLGMLDMQLQTFQNLPQESWRNHVLFFGSFDAIVMVASIYILFPQELPEFKERAAQHFQWTLERFSAMQDRNALARSARGVLRAILAKFTRAIGKTPEDIGVSGSETTISPPASRLVSVSGDGTTPSNSSSGGFATPSVGGGGPSTVSSMGPPPPSAAGYGMPPIGGSNNEWPMPVTDDLEALAPMLPTSDLIWNDLTAVQDGDLVMPPLGADTGASDPQNLAWQFDGGFGEDTVWQFLNHHFPLGAMGT